MVPPRKSKSECMQLANLTDVSPNKDDGSSKTIKKRKKKRLLEMLGPRWSKEELERFYDTYRKYGKDWRRVAAALRNRSTEMVEALYNMNKAYLSHPEGTTSAVGLIAMMTDHYNVLMARQKLAVSKNKHSCDDGSSTSRAQKTKKISTTYKKRYDELKKKKVLPNKFMSWDLMRAYGIEDKIRAFCAVGAWERFFSIKEKVYRNITIEFLSSYRLLNPEKSGKTENEIRFRLNGERHQITMREFCVRMGLYDETYSRTEEFKKLPCQFPEGVTANSYWAALTNSAGPYNPSRSKASCMTNPHHRVLHWMLSHSMSGREFSTGVVNTFDIFSLYSMIEKCPCNVGVLLAFYLQRQAKDHRVGAICCGAYVTRLLKNMGLFPPEEPTDTVGETGPLTGGPFRSWGLVKVPKMPQFQPTASEWAAATPQLPAHTIEAASFSAPALAQLNYELKKMNKKSKKFRKFVVGALKAIAQSIHPNPVELPDYFTSSDDEEDTEPTVPAIQEEMSDEELDDGEDKGEEEYNNEESHDEMEEDSDEAD